MSEPPYASNIRKLRKSLGLTQTAFASKIKTQQANVSKWENGETEPGPRPAGSMADLAGCSVEDFLDHPWDGGDPVGRAEADPGSTDDIEIQEWDIAYGMGGGTYLDLPVTGQKHKFSASWLRNFTHAPPEMVFLAKGAGDSMFPTILDSDIVIVDTSEREVRMGDKIWAIVYGNTGYIKRIRPMPDGSVKMLSDNPNVPPETAYDGELAIVGRVVAIVRKQ